MPSVRFVRMSSVKEIEEFRQAFYDTLKKEVPFHFLSKGTCYGLVEENKIVAGFCFVRRPANDLITTKMVPYFCSVLYSDDFLYGTAEVHAYFMTHKTYAVKLIIHLVKILLFSSARYFVYSYPIDQNGLEQYYAIGKPVRIYSGKPKGVADRFVNVECLTKWGIVRILFYRMLKYLRLL